MASVCPRCGSDILSGEVSTRPGAVGDEWPDESVEVVRCLCCGTDLARAAGTEEWQPATS